MTTNSTFTHGVRGLFATGLVAILAACGGSGGSSSDDGSTSGSTPVAARGIITQLGSIWVNGCRYVAAPGGTYKSDDGEPISFDDYQVGQLVSIKGTKSGASCVANEVEYEAEVEGSADVDGKINGITILQNSNTNAPGIPDPLLNGQRYEVSGVWINDFTIEATFIKEDDDSGLEALIDEIKGEVQVINSPTSFDVKDITFNMAGAAPHGLTGGEYVEVHFDNCAGVAPDLVCTASLVEIEDDIFDLAQGYEFEIEGAVDKAPTDCPPAARIKVDDLCVDIDSKPAEWLDGLEQGQFDDLVQGSRVEVEGHMVSDPTRDYLRADEVKGRGNRVRVTSIATNADDLAGTFDLFGGNINVTTMSGVTQFEDGLTINTVEAAASVEVRGVRTGPNSVLALRIKDDGGLSSGGRHELRAEVDSVTVVQDNNWSNDRLTVMGIVSQANPGTDLEIGDMVIADSDTNPATAQAIEDFLLTIDADNNPANGPRDVVEIGVDIVGPSPYTADSWEVEEEDD